MPDSPRSGAGWISAACLRAGALRLALASMLGALVIPGYVVAPILFSHAPDRQIAGMLAGEVFHACNVAVLWFSLAVAAFYHRAGERRWRCWLPLLALAALVAVNVFFVSPTIEAIKQQAGAIDALSAQDPLRASFALWHGVSAFVHLGASLLAAWLVAIGAGAQVATGDD